jgi:Flp pilus assembly protein TadB
MTWTALALGAAAGLALVIAIAEFLPRRPKLSAAFENLGGTAQTLDPDFKERLGRALQRGPFGWLAVNPRDLAMVGKTPVQHAANQALFGILGFAVPPVLGLLFIVALRLPLPLLLFSLPASAGTAVLLMWAINLTVTQKAAEDRADFGRAVATYIELVAAARKGNISSSRSLSLAADVGNSWVFVRLQQELRLATYRGIRPWDAFKSLATEIGVPELSDLADIMRLAGEEGASIYEPLRARGKGLRVQLLNEAKTRANAKVEQSTFPAGVMGMIFIALIFTPPLFRLIG